MFRAEIKDYNRLIGECIYDISSFRVHKILYINRNYRQYYLKNFMQEGESLFYYNKYPNDKI